MVFILLFYSGGCIEGSGDLHYVDFNDTAIEYIEVVFIGRCWLIENWLRNFVLKTKPVLFWHINLELLIHEIYC